MIRYGEWREVRRSAKNSKKVAFWINTLYSPFVRFSEIVKEFLDSKDSPELLQNFVNSWLAEPWEDTKLKTSADMVMERQTDLKELIVPSWASFITGGVDVQQNCLYWSIRAWGSYITEPEHRARPGAILPGSRKHHESSISDRRWRSYSGQPMSGRIQDMNTDSAYDFCASNSDWADAVKRIIKSNDVAF